MPQDQDNEVNAPYFASTIKSLDGKKGLKCRNATKNVGPDVQ